MTSLESGPAELSLSSKMDCFLNYKFGVIEPYLKSV